MQSISSLFPSMQLEVKKVKSNERGELLKYFAGRVHKPIGYIAFKLTGMELKDLYYLKSICDDSARRGNSWGKTFWGSIKAR